MIKAIYVHSPVSTDPQFKSYFPQSLERRSAGLDPLPAFSCPAVIHAWSSNGHMNNKRILPDFFTIVLPFGSYLMSLTQYKGEKRIHLFLDYLLKKSFISKDSYLATVKFGDKIVFGTGRTHMKDYRINLQYNE